MSKCRPRIWSHGNIPCGDVVLWQAITVSPDSGIPEDSVLNNKQNNFRFIFHHVLHNASQEAVYETLARDCVQV